MAHSRHELTPLDRHRLPRLIPLEQEQVRLELWPHNNVLTVCTWI